MKRIFLFLVTNLAVVFVLNITLHLLGLDRFLARAGIPYAGLLAFAIVFGMGGAFISLALSKWTAKNLTGAIVIDTPANSTEYWLLQTVQRQAATVRVGMPEVAVYDAPEPNAFATGMRRDSALVAVSSGLLANMTRDEVEGVLAHELSHVANGDMVTLALIQGVVNTFVIFLSRVIGNVVDRVVFRDEEGRGPAYFIVSMVAELLLGILASMVVMGFSRWREFRADAGGAHLAGTQRMVAALERLRTLTQSELPAQLRAFGVSGGEGGMLTRLFMSHPPLEERIARLIAAGR
jgi:heat shock protein HtpX